MVGMRWVWRASYVGAAVVGCAASADAQAAPGHFMGGPEHHGVVATEGVDRLGGLDWVFETDGPVRGSPVVVDGVVYIGSGDGRLYALDAGTGRPRWTYDAGAPLGGAPLVTRERVVVYARGNTVHALERASGRPAWTVRTGADLSLVWGHEGWDYLLPSPTLAGETVLVGSGDGHLYALGLADGVERWRFRTGGRIRSAAAVADGVAYVGSGDGSVYGVSVDDGREVWRYATDGIHLRAADFGFDRTQIQSSPTVAGSRLYIGSRDASLYAINLRTGERVWRAEDGSSWVVNTAALDGPTLYSGRSSSGRFRAHEAATGRELWLHQTGGMIYSSPAVVGETVYFGSGDRRVRALDARDGSVRWSYATDGMVVSSPAVWNGRLFVGSDDGNVYAFRGAAGPQTRLAVYWDDTMRERSLFGSRDTDRRLSEFFEARAYEPLDTAGLREFLEARIADRAPSVVVSGMDGWPAAVASPDAPETSLLRRYLDAGGKIVWSGYPPLSIERNAEGGITGVTRETPKRLLGIDFEEWDEDHYGARVTEAGRRWGLDSDFIGTPGLAVEEASTVLALEETGRASAWVRSYGGPVGSGFVFMPLTVDTGRLREMRRVAEYGIFRRDTDGTR